ncbi:helix-turn-helix transcriptional regulator [Micromonospora chersina]|uniref:helix-turn-helix transcriptional regulator n=1 Tax=Micromonospora chersina TaxID=47854 RepID=UPI0033CC7CDD
MDRMKLADALTRLGVPIASASVYVRLLDRAPGRLDALAADLGMEVGQVREAYDHLVTLGLASAVGDSGDFVTPRPPAACLDLLTRQRAAELDAARLAVTGAFESFRRLRLSQYTDNLVEVITGEQIRWRIKQDMDGVRQQIRRFDSPPYFFSGSVNAEEELEQLGRGITHRTIYARAALEQPDYLAGNIEPCIRAGEEARVSPSLPVKLTLVDDSIAHVSLSITEADVNSSLLVVRPCGLFSALTALFELSWQTALPFYGGDAAPARLPPAERKLLSLLAVGLPDERIAVDLGISRRTFYRRVELLMTKLGASTRFQLALHATRRGLL